MQLTEHILYSFLKALKVPFTDYQLDKLISEGVSKDTLYSIADVLKDDYNTESMCLLIEKDDIVKLDTPFIVQFDLPGYPLVLVTHVGRDHIDYIYKNQKVKEPRSSFFSKWNGAVLVAEPEAKSKEKEYLSNLIWQIVLKARLPLIFLFAVIIILYFSNSWLMNLQWRDWYLPTAFFTYGLGLLLSGLLLSQSIVKSGSIVDRICKAGGKKGCSRILEGDAATIGELVSWSEVGFLYFAGCILNILINPTVGIYLYYISIPALAYTCWSVYYQWRIAGEWCPFCLGVQAILWITFLVNLTYFGTRSHQSDLFVDMVTLLRGIGCFLSVAVAMWLVIPYAKADQELKAIKKEYNGLKFSEKIIKTVFESSNPTKTEGISSVVLGNANAPALVTVVTDLTCPHCIKAHKHLKALLTHYREKVRIQIVFSVLPTKVNSGSYYNTIAQGKNGFTQHMVSLFSSNEPEVAERIFHEWYDGKKKDFKKFMSRYPLTSSINCAEEEMQRHIEWCGRERILGTPTFFINNYRLPQWYKVTDLKSLITMLTD